MPFRVLCFEPNPIDRLGLQVLSQRNDFEFDTIVGCLSDFKSALSQSHYDAVVSGEELENQDVFTFLESLGPQGKELRWILYADVEKLSTFARSVVYGLYDVVPKCTTSETLFESIRSLQMGAPPSESLIVRFRNFMKKDDWPKLPMADSLTRREVQSLAMLGLGLSNKEIARAMGISLEMCKENIKNVLRKTGARDRTAAAVWSHQVAGDLMQFPTL